MAITIDNRHLASLLQTDFTTVKVRFRDGNNTRLYTYKVPNDLQVQVDDMLVVDAHYSGVCIVDVKEVHERPQIDPDANFDYKWVVGKVDLESYRKRAEAEAEFRQLVRDLTIAHEVDEFLGKLPKKLRKEFKKAAAKIQG